MARRGGNNHLQRQKELKEKDFNRQKAYKSKVPDVIIACEDSDSSPTYFKQIVSKLREEKRITPDSLVVAKHRHTNPLGVLKDLIEHRCDNGKTYKNFEHKWIVIDRDIARVNGGGHKKEDFNLALQKAKKDNVKVAYSNDSFELWYLLHFEYRDTAILRDEISDKVIKKIKSINPHKFSSLDRKTIKQKNVTKDIFNALIDLQDIAVKNAKKLLESYGDSHDPESDNPSTTVHLLVEVLKGLDR